MERCPQCRARLKGRTICSRCGVDLGFVLAIEVKAEIMSRRAVKSLGAGDIRAAGEQAAAARQLNGTLFHRALAGFIEQMQNNMSSSSRGGRVSEYSE